MAFSLIIRLVALCLLPLVSCTPVWSRARFHELEAVWDQRNFPPNITRADDILGVCKRNITLQRYTDIAQRGIRYICSLFEEFVNEKCSKDQEEDEQATSKFITDLLAHREGGRFYKLCDDKSGFRITESVRLVLDENTCTVACSGENAEKLCRLIVMFSLSDYEYMDAAAKKLKQNQTTTETPTTLKGVTQTLTISDNTTLSNNHTNTEENKTDPTIKPTQKSESPETSTTIKGVKDKPTTKVSQMKVTTTAGYVTSGQLAIYGVSFFLLCGIFFAAYKYRHSILYCLREDQAGGPPAKDGKGGYRKVPNFERVLPNMEDREKAKSFIY